jgi:ADP-heptose:LPS heptosyltransferase
VIGPGARAGHSPVAILRALGLGDLLATVPALRALAEGLAGRDLVLVTPLALAPLVALVPGPAGRRLRVAGADELRSLPGAAAGAAPAVNLHGMGPESHRLLVDAGCRTLLAFRHPDVPQSAGGPAWEPDEHEVDRWCRLVRHAGFDADPHRLDLRRPAGADEHPLAGATVVHPGAASPSRRWPAERFASVARQVAAAAGLPSTAAVAGRTTVAGLAEIVAAAGRVVCGDTGVGHLATAFGTPSVVVFGPTPPTVWGPPPARRDRHRVLWSGRAGDPHAPSADPGLLEIGPDRVLRELEELPAAI